MSMFIDAPKTLGSKDECATRIDMLSQSHVLSLVRLVEKIRLTKGHEFEIPYFDPLDGGSHAEVLFLLEAPGRKAIATGFVSRNNPDETAKNFFELNAEAGIDRLRTVIWNAVPWYIGSGNRIRPANRNDVLDAYEWLSELLTLLHKIRFVVLVGKKALHAQSLIRDLRPNLEIMTMPHPSPLYVNRAPGNRQIALESLTLLAARMAARFQNFDE